MIGANGILVNHILEQLIDVRMLYRTEVCDIQIASPGVLAPRNGTAQDRAPFDERRQMRDLTRKPLNVFHGRPRKVSNLVVKIEARHRELLSLTPVQSGEKALEKMCRANIIISSFASKVFCHKEAQKAQMGSAPF
jgi:hypothetical protein